MQRIARFALASMSLAGAAMGCTGGSADTGRSATACERLRDHVVDLRVAEIHQDREAHRAALQRALSTRFINECISQPSTRFECEMNAATIDGLRDCAAAD